MKIIINILISLIFLVSCVSKGKLPTENCIPGKTFFLVRKGFEIQHKSCDGLDAKSWLVSVSIWSRKCTRTKTKLFAFWDGCGYRLYKQKIPDDFSNFEFIKRFPDLRSLKNFLKLNKPFDKIKPIRRNEWSIFDDIFKQEKK